MLVLGSGLAAVFRAFCPIQDVGEVDGIYLFNSWGRTFAGLAGFSARGLDQIPIMTPEWFTLRRIVSK